MPKFKVIYSEEHIQYVEADSPAEARDLVAEGDHDCSESGECGEIDRVECIKLDDDKNDKELAPA